MFIHTMLIGLDRIKLSTRSVLFLSFFWSSSFFCLSFSAWVDGWVDALARSCLAFDQRTTIEYRPASHSVCISLYTRSFLVFNMGDSDDEDEDEDRMFVIGLESTV